MWSIVMDHLTHIVPLLCQQFVGRQQELQALKGILSHAATGQAQFCLLSGEAGLGKTRLCHAFLHLCQEQQATVLLGQAALQDQKLPFGPFLDLFHRSLDVFAEASTAFRQELQATFSFLLQLSPALASLFPTLPVSDVTSVPVQQQSILFHQVLRGLQTLAKTCPGPLVVVLEDLHWADETSLELLMFLAHRLGMNTPFATPSTALLILGTYRSEAFPGSPALQRLLSHLTAQRQVKHIQLSPLNEDEHRQCVNHILRQEVPEEFSRFLFGWDEGNPFFTEELLSAMVTGGQIQAQGQRWLLPHEQKIYLPQSLTSAILERFASLPVLDQEVLSYAAVIGRTFHFSLLAALCKIDEHTLVSVLRRAINIQLITSPPHKERSRQELYQFRHALTREALYEQMLLSERRIRHRAVAEAIEAFFVKNGAISSMRLDNAPRLLVEHYHLAGLDERVQAYALQEAQQASQVGAFREERFYLGLALPGLGKESSERLQMLERLGSVCMGISNFVDGLRWLSLAKEGYQQMGYPSDVLRVLALMIMPAWFLASPMLPNLLTEIETGIEASFAFSDEAERNVHLLYAASIFTAYQVTNNFHQHIYRLVERNNALFDALVDPRKMAAIQINNMAYHYARANIQAQFVEESIAGLRHALHLAHQYSLPHIIVFGYWSLTTVLVFVGQLDEAKKLVEEIVEYEQASGMQRGADIIGWMCFFSGEQWEQGIKELSSTVQTMKQAKILMPAATSAVVLAHLLLARNEPGKAQQCFDAAQAILEQVGGNRYLFWLEWGLAKLHMALKNVQWAGAWYERAFQRWKATDEALFVIPFLRDGITFYAQIGNAERTQTWLAELQAVVTQTENPVGRAALLEAQGIVALRRRTLEPAIVTLRQAVDAWGALKFRYYQAEAAQRLAEVLLQQADRRSTSNRERQQIREEAESLLQLADQVYERLGIIDRREAVLQLRVRARLDAQLKRRKTMAVQRQVEGLTARETQVLRRLAAGETNKEIAVTLGITIGTVEQHVTRILNKLDCESRTQAVLYAVAKGWIEPPS
jgi:DNA-binding CsgD family transcriptional regulator